MPKRCLFGCPPNPGTPMHTFPHPVKFKEQFEAWVKVAGGQLETYLDYQHFRKKLVCDRHFTQKDHNRNNRVHALAVPSLHLPVTQTSSDATKKEITEVAAETSATDTATRILKNAEVDFQEMEEDRISCPSPDPKNPIQTNENLTSRQRKNLEYWKHKLTNVFNSVKFCGICLENNDYLLYVADHLEIRVANWSWKKTLSKIVQEVFNHQDVLSSLYMCEKCCEKLIQAYLFIYTTKKVAEIMNNYANDLHFKITSLPSHLSEQSYANVVIIFENNNGAHFSPEIFTADGQEFISELNIEDENNDAEKNENKLHDEKNDDTVAKTENESNSIKNEDGFNFDEETLDEKFECTFCSKSFKTNEYLIAHYNEHAKVDCKFCPMIISKNDLVDHLRKNHKSNIFLCKLCNIPYYSESGLNSHLKAKHPSEHEKLKTQCDLCLKNFQPERLKSHLCKFRCLECSEMPCIHHKYLISYRDQIFKKAGKVKCLDCDYTCLTKEIFLGHINREHLNLRPHICDKCGELFHYKNVLIQHIRRFHKDYFNCKYCDKLFINRQHLKCHEKCCQLIKRKCPCKICPATFENEQRLDSHEKLKHSTEVFSCRMCNRKFGSESKKIFHMLAIHSNLREKKRKIETL